MILDSTYTTKDEEKLIRAKVGKPISILKRLQLGGIGSYKMTVVSFSNGFKILRKNNDSLTANIELRPKGILVHLNQRGTRYTWVIAYHHLAIFSSETYNIHAAGEFLKFEKNKAFGINEKFLNRMLQEKQKQLSY
ncbi:hypothetical protein SAMN05216474_1378 [Lishizhenia tianjinensis]|uniref:PH domain-containing protein n=1 Tax=Lishizhenia tianjinensis TaxID=477690 RepID=A0A1I6ZI03_9FLAO|nr:hypothetical protein [Lishizhenia tianjinensis]SFT62326.1 hypothetical protein SAMN05216474_1378 [Lishizhenia tianjinensis]